MDVKKQQIIAEFILNKPESDSKRAEFMDVVIPVIKWALKDQGLFINNKYSFILKNIRITVDEKNYKGKEIIYNSGNEEIVVLYNYGEYDVRHIDIKDLNLEEIYEIFVQSIKARETMYKHKVDAEKRAKWEEERDRFYEKW